MLTLFCLQFLQFYSSYSCEVTNVQDVVGGCRSNVDSFQNQIYTKALAIAEMIDVQESSPRPVSREKHQSNVHA